MADEEEGNNDEDKDFHHCSGLSPSTVVDKHNCLRVLVRERVVISR